MRQAIGSLGLFCAAWLYQATDLLAAEIYLTPSQNLQQVVDHAAAGDRLILEPGTYPGNLVISQSIELRGKPGAVIDAEHRGHGLQVLASGVHLEGLEIRNWGDDLSTMDAGIFVEQSAQGVVISHNQLRGDAFGIWLDSTTDATVTNNKIQGNTRIRSSDRGNGIHLSSVTGALIQDNEVWHTRDGLYIESSNGNKLTGNYLHDLRYGVHYMYSYSNEVSHNHTQNTRTGYALMQSKYLTVTHNRSQDDRNYGILMNFITNSTIANNRVEGVQSGRSSKFRRSKFQKSPATISGAEGKAIFMYNSLFNEVTDNLLASSDLGIHLTAGSEDNQFSGNAFINNKEQVKYVANRQQDWSHQGRGNYWSDYLGWDMDDDGIGDIHYEPNDGIDKLLWKYPAAKVLMNSPAIETLRWVQRQFPVLKPTGVRDSHPLMSSPYLSQNQQP